MKTLVIAAGTGFLGQTLVTHFKADFDKIVILTRAKARVVKNIHYINWNAKSLTGWEKELENAEVLINLTGKSVDCRYTEANKLEILASRADSTAVLNTAVLQCTNPPKHWLNSSTATIYRFSLDKQMDEEDGEIGDGFSVNVAKTWEATFFGTNTPHTLKTALRTSIALGKNGGAFVPLKNLTLAGFGGKQGNGQQFISWIHEIDFARAISFIISKRIAGAVNIVSPMPIRNVDFMHGLRKKLQVVGGIPMGKKLLEFGAKIIGTETELILKSRNVIPAKLRAAGFTFEYGSLEDALENLIRKS